MKDFSQCAIYIYIFKELFEVYHSAPTRIAMLLLLMRSGERYSVYQMVVSFPLSLMCLWNKPKTVLRIQPTFTPALSVFVDQHHASKLTFFTTYRFPFQNLSCKVSLMWLLSSWPPYNENLAAQLVDKDTRIQLLAAKRKCLLLINSMFCLSFDQEVLKDLLYFNVYNC